MLVTNLETHTMEKTISNAIKSIIAGIIMAIITGFLTSETKYRNSSGREINEERYNDIDDVLKSNFMKQEKFNYKVGLISGALITGCLMFIYYDEKNKNLFLKRIGKSEKK